MKWRLRREHAAPGPEALPRLELELPAGRGRAHAPIVWLCLASFLTWGHPNDTRVWPTNETISKITGTPLRAVEYGIAMLRRAGKISVTYGWRPKHGYGRIVTMHLLPSEHGNPRVVLPSPADMREIWRRARETRERPATVVALGLAAHVWAAAKRGKVGRSRTIAPKLTQLQRLVGASHGSTFTARLEQLALAGIIERAGALWREGLVVFGRWAIRELQRVLERPVLPAMPMRMCRPVTEKDRLAEMSEAFARLYA